MKKIKLNGKLGLNKITVSKLNEEGMNTVKGGSTSIVIIILPTTTITDITNYDTCDGNCRPDYRTVA